jgi:[acyl-carrier-protein] S-malonyltransferase
MFEAGRERPGTMAAVLGLSSEDVAAACAEAAASGTVVPANLNAPGQIVISGDVAAVRHAGERCTARGAKRVIGLEVSGAFHSPLMRTASRGLTERLAAARFSDARCPVVANVSAEPVQVAEDVRRALDAQLLSAVRWEESMRRLLALGARGFVEIGAGRVLRGLLRTIDRGAASWNVEDPESLASTLAGLGVTAPAGGAA